MKKNIEDWTHQSICECRLPDPFDPAIPHRVLECLRELTIFRESGQSSQKRFSLLSQVGVDVNIFQSAHFSSFGFPHVLEHATLDFDDPIHWKEYLESRKYVLEHWVLETLEDAYLDIFVVEKSIRGIQVCSLLTGKRSPVHLSFFDVPIRKGDYFIGRLFKTSEINFVTFPFILKKEDALSQATHLQNIYAQTRENVSLKSFMKTKGAIEMLTFMVQEFNALLESDLSLSNLSPKNLNALQEAFASLSRSVETDSCTYEGFTSEGWMYSFVPRTLPELHIYFDMNAREMMIDGGSFRTTKGYLSLYWLPGDSVGYATLMGSPNWCVALTRRGDELAAEDPKDADADILIRVIKGIKKELSTNYHLAA